MKRTCASFVAALWVSCLAPAVADAAGDVELTIEGPDQVFLVAPANLANTNLNRATVEPRDLQAGRLKQLLAPAIASALQQCNASDIRAITLRAANAPDRIGGTTTRFGGLGIYANLPSNDRSSQGNWFIAPYFWFEGSVTTTGGATEAVELFDVNKIFLQNDRTPQEEFFRFRTKDVEASLEKFVGTNLPKAVRTALSSHCKG